MTKDREATPVNQGTLETKLDHAKVQMRHEIYECLGGKHFRNLVQIEIYKILEGCLMFMGVIGIVIILLIGLTKLIEEGEGREVLAPISSFSERP